MFQDALDRALNTFKIMTSSQPGHWRIKQLDAQELVEIQRGMLTPTRAIIVHVCDFMNDGICTFEL